MLEPLRVVMVSPRNPLNIGAAARAMSNFGVTTLRLVNPYDVAFREARSAVKSHYILEQAEIFDSLAPAIADCALVVGTTASDARDLHVPLYRLEAAAPLIHARLAQGPVALLFGSEKFGLSNEDMSLCHWLLRIPARNEHGSMNLGQAVAICLYELRRDAAQVKTTPTAPALATGEDHERLAEILLELLRRSNYIKGTTSASTGLKLQRLLRRATLSSSDARVWLGMFRQMLWKIKPPERD